MQSSSETLLPILNWVIHLNILWQGLFHISWTRLFETHVKYIVIVLHAKPEIDELVVKLRAHGIDNLTMPAGMGKLSISCVLCMYMYYVLRQLF